MKNKLIVFSVVTSASALLFSGCKDSFLEPAPQGVYTESQLLNKQGLNGMLINAYATLDGYEGVQAAGASNWIWGSIRGGDAYKGTEELDYVDINPIMRYEVQPNNQQGVLRKWDGTWDGVGQSNNVLKILPRIEDMTDAEKTQAEAEARFLRGHHHFEAKKVWGNIPYIDETVVDFKVPNTEGGSNYVDIWPQIEADFKFAYDNLDEVKPNKGRVNKWAAAAFLAKAYLFQNKFTEAKALFDEIITKGKNSQGAPYNLTPNYHTNFRVTSENNEETVFAVQSSYGDGSNNNGNYDNNLNFPHGSGSKPGGCCGFFQPSQNLVNSFKTDANGLPLPDTYNNTDVTSDEAVLSADPFTPYQGNLDPRLDWTVGRRGVPYYDWGNHPGRDWIRFVSYGGPYSPKKNTWYKADEGSVAGKVGWGYSSNSLNYTIMRFADVLLMAAEAEIEVGSLEKAREYINRVRDRADNFAPAPTAPFYVASNDASVTWANYKVGLYPAFASKDEAKKAVRFERKLELGMEGHRFFDLLRWGIAADYINNEYLAKEKVRRKSALDGAVFDANKDELQPIPTFAITQSIKDGQPTLKQNPGY